MRIKELLLKLIDIERAIGTEEPFRLREMVMQAQECLLAIQKSLADQLPDQRLAPATVAAIGSRNYRRLRHRADSGEL